MKRRLSLVFALTVGLALLLTWAVAAQSTKAATGSQPASSAIVSGLGDSHSTRQRAASLGYTSPITFTPSVTVYLPATLKNHVACVTIPRLISPPDDSSLDNLIPLFQWDNENDPHATAVNLEAARDPEFAHPVYSYWTSATTQGPSEYRFIRNFDPTTKFYWRVFLECGEGAQGPYSEVRSFTAGSGGTILPAPALIAPADGGAIPATTANLEWSSVTGAVEYRAHWRKAGTTGSFFRRVDGTKATASGLSANTTYEWWSAARNDYAWSSESPHWTFTTGAATSSSTADCPDPIVIESSGTSVMVEKETAGACRRK